MKEFPEKLISSLDQINWYYRNRFNIDLNRMKMPTANFLCVS